MGNEKLIEQLLGLEDTGAQRRFLDQKLDQVDASLAPTLKDRATQLLRSDIQTSLQIADLLFYLAERTGRPTDRALALLAEANARSIGLGEYREGVALYDAAAEIYAGEGLPVDQARSQVGKIWALVNLSRHDDALEAGRWASRILEEHGEWQTLAGLTMNLAIVYGLAGDDTQSLVMFDRAASLYEKMEAVGSGEWLHVQQNRAIALRNLGRFEESIQTSQAAIEDLETLGQKVAAARARQALAVTCFVLGRYNEALGHLDEVRDVFLADGRQRDAMLVELYVSDCLLQLRRFGDVLEKCREVRKLFAELGMHHSVAQAVINEAVAYAELGRHAQALASLAEARQTFCDEENDVWSALADLEKAAVLLRMDPQAKGTSAEEALATARACMIVFAAHDLPIEGAQARLVAARAAVVSGQPDQAVRLANAALETGQERDMPTLTYRAHQLLGNLASERGDSVSALMMYDRAIAEVERLRGRLMVEHRVGFVEDKEEIYGSAVESCLDLGLPLRGLEYAERAKSRALLDLLAYRLDLGIQALSEADRPLVEDMERLRAQRDRLYRRWESEPESEERGRSAPKGAPGPAEQEILALEKEITALWHRLLVRNADYARDASLWTVRTELVQPYLAPETLLLEYYVVHGRLVVFLVTAGDVEARRLDCDLDQAQQAIELLWLNLRTVSRCPPERATVLVGNIRGILMRLFDMVLAPLSDLLARYHDLVIVPHGALHYLPFQALYDGAGYVLQRHQVSYLPSASLMRYCHEARKGEGGLIAVGHSSGGRLPHATQEASAVAALMGGQCLIEAAATRSALIPLLAGCGALHLAAHGDFRPANPLFSGLALADGWLTTLDIFGLRLNASLVTLSACQTGRSVIGGGDELLGLMRAFLYAGAASLVLSLWAVEDRSTALLMETFYTKLAEGWTKGRALRHAQLRFLEGGDGTDAEDRSHPYFWAPFFLVGNSGVL